MNASTEEEIRNSPAYWFAVMEAARNSGRFVTAQQALDELRRLGVHVRFEGGTRDRRTHKGVGA
jgi:hypothetical protein